MHPDLWSSFFTNYHKLSSFSRYVEIGDQIALQYGGSEAHKKVASGATSTIPGPMGKVSETLIPGLIDVKLCFHLIFQFCSYNQHKELLTSIRRYVSSILRCEDVLLLVTQHTFHSSHSTAMPLQIVSSKMLWTCFLDTTSLVATQHHYGS